MEEPALLPVCIPGARVMAQDSSGGAALLLQIMIMLDTFKAMPCGDSRLDS